LGLAAALAVYGLTRAPIPPGLLAIGAALAVLLLALGVAGILPAAIGWVMGLIGIAYAVSLYAMAAPIDPLAPAVACGLLLVGELSYWSLELRRRATGRALISIRRALSIAGLTAATGVMGSLILLVASLPLVGSLLITMAGAAAALGAFALVMLLARRLAG
jgi:hypothetical protein